MKFNKFTKWFLNATLASSLLLTQPCFAQQTASKEKTLSLEQTLVTGGEIKDVLQQKKADVKFKFQYDQENKELGIGIYTQDWNKEIQLQEGKIHELDNMEKINKEYINIRNDSELYLILRKSFNIEDIIQKGYIIQNEGNKASGKWERLIPYGKNPDLKLKSFISKRTFSEVLDFFNRSDSKSSLNAISDFFSGKRDQKVDDIAEQMGEEYNVFKIELYTPKGWETKVNSATEIRLKFKNNPEEDRNTLFVYNLNFGVANAPISFLHSKGTVAFDIQGLKQSSYRYPDQSNPKNAYITYKLAVLKEDKETAENVLSKRLLNPNTDFNLFDKRAFYGSMELLEQEYDTKDYILEENPSNSANLENKNILIREYQKQLEINAETFYILNNNYAFVVDSINNENLFKKEGNIWKLERFWELLENEKFKNDWTNYWVKTIADAVDRYYDINGNYPSIMKGAPLFSRYYFSNSLSQKRADYFKCVLLNYGIIDFYNKEPIQEYFYGGGGKSFEIFSVGPNGECETNFGEEGDDIGIYKIKEK